MTAFDVNSYVTDRLNKDGINKDDINYEPIKESFRKQVVKVLKYFKCINNEDSKDKIDLFDDKDKHIFVCFPFGSLADTDKKSFLDFIFDKKNNDSSKFVANINKVHIDSKVNSKEYNITYIREERNFKGDLNIEEENSQYKFECQYTQYNNRNIIRAGELFSNEIDLGISTIIKCLKDEKFYFNLSLATDIVSDCCLQILTYWVISMEGLDEKQVEGLLKSLKDYIKSFNSNLVLWQTEKEISYKDAVGIYAAFLERRNNYGQYLDIIQVLEEEAMLHPLNFSIPSKEYKVTKNMDFPQNFKNILTEGKSIDNFDEKLKNTKNLIDKFSKYGGRNASIDNIMDLKVYFREFYLSDSGYKNQAQTIVRKYIATYEKSNLVDSFAKTSEYQFLREKLNRGYFRETIGLTRYNKKNEMQKIIYNALLLIFLTYDYDKIMDLLISFVSGFTKTYRSCIKIIV